MRFGAEEPSDGEDAGKRQEYETVCSGRCCGSDPGMERRLWDFRGDGAGIATAVEEGKQSSLRGSEPFWAMPTRAMRLYRPALIREC